MLIIYLLTINLSPSISPSNTAPFLTDPASGPDFSVSPGDIEMRPVLTKIASGAPQAIYMPTFIAETAHCVRQAKEIAWLEKVVLMGAEGSFSPDFLTAAGNAAVGMYHSSPFWKQY